MEGSTIQDWKLFRQFQKTLESLSNCGEDQDWLNSNDKKIITQEERLEDLLEITSIEDEGEQLGGQDNYLQKFNDKFLLKTYFDTWKDSVELSGNKRRKAEFYHRFNSLERFFKAWKVGVKLRKQKRDHDNWIKAIYFYETCLLRSHLSTWRGYTHLMKSKKELRNLEKQKDKSSAKVSQFLLNLQTLKNQLTSSSSERGKPRRPVSSMPHSPWRSTSVNNKKLVHLKLDLPTEPPSVDRLSPLSKNRGCLGQGDPSQVDEAGHPLVSIKEAATIVADLRSNLLQTSAQRLSLQEQAKRLKFQQKELEEMELMMDQLQTGRAITNLELYKSLVFKQQVKGEKEAQKAKVKHGKRQLERKEALVVAASDFSNLRGQAPVVTRRKLLRNIIVPQEEVIKVNREFLISNDKEFESDDSEPELSHLFKNEEDENESNKSANAAAVPTPPFLVQMKKRQEERAQKWEEIRLMHEKKAEEKRRQAFEAETLRIQKEEEEKLKKLRMKKKLRKQAILEQKIRDEEIERAKFLTRKAKSFNEIRLMKRHGFEPWKAMMRDKKLNEFLADKHYEDLLMRNALKDWIHLTRSSIIMRRVKAEELERQKLMQNSFEQWIDVQKNSKRKLQSAFDYNEMRLTALMFRNWRAINDQESRKMFKKDLQAIQHHRRNILKRLLHSWIKFVSLRDDFKTAEQIRRQFLQKIGLEITDYIPSLN